MNATRTASILILCLAWNGLDAVAAIGADKPASNTVKTIKKFSTADKLIAKDGVSVDENAWRIEAKGKRTVRLFEVPDPGVENCTVLYRAKMKSESLDGQAYLEMRCRVEGGGEAFSKGLNDAVTGTTDWASYEIPFLLKKGESCNLIKLNVAMEGKGTLWIKDIELIRAPLKPEAATESAPKSNGVAAEKPASGGGNAMELNRQGWMLFQKGEMAGAQKAFERVIAINPRHPAALNGLGQLYLMQRKYEQAENYLLKAAPQAPAAWYGLARLYLLQKKFDKAEKWAKKIVDSGQADNGAKKMLQAAKDKRLNDDLRQMIEPPPTEAESDATDTSKVKE